MFKYKKNDICKKIMIFIRRSIILIQVHEKIIPLSYKRSIVITGNITMIAFLKEEFLCAHF